MSRTCLYIGNLSTSAETEDLERFFRDFGKCRVMAIKHGFAFVEFNDPRDADDAVRVKDGASLMGRRVRVEIAKGSKNRGYDVTVYGSGGSSEYSTGTGNGDRRNRKGSGKPPGRRTGYYLIVENLSHRISWQDLKDFFRSAGEVTYANAHKPCLGQGVVEFGHRKDMEYALKHMDGKKIDGIKIKLERERESGNSRSRSRSRSLSRDRDRDGRSRRRRSHSRSTKSRSLSRD